MNGKISLKNNLLVLVLIIFLGLLLRVVFINSSPLSLYGDELTITLDAYSLLKTGQDQLGNFMPLTFPMGAGRPAGYVYGSIPFIAVFGPTALGVRALSVLSGIGIIVLIYLVGKRFFSEKVGLLAAAVFAVSPWDIALSRGGFEAHFALFLVLLGIYLFIRANQKPILYLFSAFSFGLTIHTYPTYKVSLILLLPLLFWYTGGIKENLNIKSKYLLAGAFILVILGVLSLSQTFIGGSETRFANINIFSEGKLKETVVQKINLERQMSNLPAVLSNYFHNKPVEYTKVFIENYLQNFSLDFLILHGDRNPRHNMATMGEIYFVDIILIFIGFFAFREKQKKTIVFLVAWIFLAPVPSAIIDFPHALRSSLMLPPLIIFSALGLAIILSKRSKLLLPILIVLFVIQFVFFIQKLIFLAPNEYANFWSYQAKLASQIANQNKDRYDYIVISDRINDIEFAYPVYSKINPVIVINQNTEKSQLINYPLKKFNNVFVGHIPKGELPKFINDLPGSVLYLEPRTADTTLTDYEIINSNNAEQALIEKKKP